LSEVVSVTDVVEHAFCPMFTYFRLVMGMPQYEKRRGTVQKGRAIHEIRQRNNPGYIPKNLEGGTKVMGVTLYSSKLGLVGKIDHAIITNDQIVIFEQKYAKSFLGKTLRVQLGLLATLLEEHYGKPCKQAVVQFLVKPCKTVRIIIDERIRAEALQTLSDLRRVLDSCQMPSSHYDGRCEDCTYRLVCPTVSLKRRQ